MYGGKQMGVVEKVRAGMSRQEVLAVLGPPDDVGGTSRKVPEPSIFKYGQVELHFEPWKDGRLLRAYAEDERGVGTVLLD
jgi:hypothetical protein